MMEDRDLCRGWGDRIDMMVLVRWGLCRGWGDRI